MAVKYGCVREVNIIELLLYHSQIMQNMNLSISESYQYQCQLKLKTTALIQ